MTFDHSLDLPFEKVPDGPLNVDMENVLIAGGLVVMAACIPLTGLTDIEQGTANHKVTPALVFRFVDPMGQDYPPMVLILDDDQMGKLRPLVNQAIHAAREGARNHPDNQ